MRKILTLLLATMVIGGCSSTPKMDGTPSPEVSTSTDSISSEKKLFDVTIHLPASMFKDVSKEDIETSAKEKGIKKVQINEDGSVDYTMSNSTHEELLKNMRSEFSENIAELLSDKEMYPSFSEITFNDDMSEFTVVCTSTNLNMSENMSSLLFMMTGGMYQSFNGVNQGETRVIVNYKLSDTGEIFQTSDSDNIGN